jgi:hypothetical protein
MEAIMNLANSPVLWCLAFASISIVLWQTWIYYRMAKNYVNETKVMSPKEINTSMKVGVISTIGPSVAVFTVAVVLIGLIGGPITLSRIGVIGSAAFESLASSAGSGGTVGTQAFTFSLFTTASWVMALGGSGWLVTTFFLTKGLDATQEKMKASNPETIRLVGSIAPFMVFFIMGYGECMKKITTPAPRYGVLAALIAGAVTMYGVNKIGMSKKNMNWLREWSMGFAVIMAMIVGALID